MIKRLPAIILLLCSAGFIWGLVQLFNLRFQIGDVYPEYSSLRSDPLGAMAFSEALQQIPGISVRRDFNSQNQLPDGKQTTYLHLAARSFEWTSLPEELFQEIDGFLARGGRLVITFFPEMSKPFLFSDNDSISPEKDPKKAEPSGKRSPVRRTGKKGLPKDGEEETARRASVKDRWGLELVFSPLHTSDTGSYLPARVVNQTDLPLPEGLDWHSALVLTNLGAAWQPIYVRGKQAVLVERKFGPGAIVVATDSFFLSNEAMLKERHADLLAWIIGSNHNIVFDEAHFGILENPGVATLMRKYRLHGFFAGLLLLAGLFIWKNSSSFVPPYPNETQAAYVEGKDAAAGFINLLRRNLPARDLPRVCLDSWKKSFMHQRQTANARVQQATAILEAEQSQPPRLRDPIKTYQELCRVLGKRTH